MGWFGVLAGDTRHWRTHSSNTRRLTGTRCMRIATVVAHTTRRASGKAGRKTAKKEGRIKRKRDRQKMGDNAAEPSSKQTTHSVSHMLIV